VVAANPADVAEVYGLTNVLGPWSGTNALPNDRGTLRLRNAQGAIQFEMTYSDQPPYPAAPDGEGIRWCWPGQLRGTGRPRLGSE